MATKIERAEFERLASSVDTLAQSVNAQAVAFGKLQQVVADQNVRLFGSDGQPGALKTLYDFSEKHSETAKADIAKVTETAGLITLRVAALESSKSRITAARTAVVSLLAGETALIGWMVRYYSNIITTIHHVVAPK